jgi:hypothetical protein
MCTKGNDALIRGHWQKEKANNLIDWPTNEKMKKLVWSVPLSKIAIQLNVSVNTIKKRCDTNNIKRPPKDFWWRAGKTNHASLTQ